MSFLAKFTLGLLLIAASTAKAAITSVGDITPSNPSAWVLSTTGYIGNTYSGTLGIDNADILFSDESFLGFNWDAEGTVTISDINSTWNTNTLYVGYRGNGELNISNSGTVSSYQGKLGYEIGSTGTINVSGNGSTWENAGDLTLGRFGNGRLNISDGGNVRCSESQLGFDDSSVATVDVSGNGSIWSNTGGLCVGNGGKGTLNITDKGLVSVAGTFTIDADNSGDSFVNMASGGMLALLGRAEDSLTTFLNLIQGTDAIRWWDESLLDWAPLTTASLGTDYTLQYQTEGILNGYTILTVQNELLPGDANGDGKVNGSDVTILAGNWQILVDATWDMGDFNGDGAVNGSDVTILAGNWQAGVNTTTALTVPEPGTLLTLLFGLLALGFVRHIK